MSTRRPDALAVLVRRRSARAGGARAAGRRRRAAVRPAAAGAAGRDRRPRRRRRRSRRSRRPTARCCSCIGGGLLVLFVVIGRVITRDARQTLRETAATTRPAAAARPGPAPPRAPDEGEGAREDEGAARARAARTADVRPAAGDQPTTVAHAQHRVGRARSSSTRPLEAGERRRARGSRRCARARRRAANTNTGPTLPNGRSPLNSLPSAAETPRRAACPGATTSTRSQSTAREPAQVDVAARRSSADRAREALREQVVDRDAVLLARAEDDQPEHSRRRRRAARRPRSGPGSWRKPRIPAPRMSPVHEPLPPNVSFPALEEQVLARWRERDVFRAIAAQPRGRRRRSSSTRARRPRTATPARTTSSRASSRTSSRATRR